MTDEDPDEAVGYCRPPRHTRFKPGQSGNPSGRSKNAESHRRLLEKALEEPIEVVEGGKSYSIRRSEAMYRSLVSRAAGGDMRAAALVTRLAEKLGISGPSDGDDKTIIVHLQRFSDG
jgi:hypothetical protein